MRIVHIIDIHNHNKEADFWICRKFTSIKIAKDYPEDIFDFEVYTTCKYKLISYHRQTDGTVFSFAIADKIKEFKWIMLMCHAMNGCIDLPYVFTNEDECLKMCKEINDGLSGSQWKSFIQKCEHRLEIYKRALTQRFDI